jgi:hypothetical protein
MLLRLAARRGGVGHTLKINGCILLALRPTSGLGHRQLSTTPPEGGPETPAKPVKKFPMKLGGNMKIKVSCDNNTIITIIIVIFIIIIIIIISIILYLNKNQLLLLCADDQHQASKCSGGG